MEEVFTKKVEFVEWFLNNNKLALSSAEWMLRKIIASDLITRVHFTGNVKYKKCYATMVTCDYEGKEDEGFYCFINDEKMTHKAFISYLVEKNTEEFYIQFKYKNEEVSTMLKVISPNEYETLEDVFIEIFLRNNIAKVELEKLRKEADNALIIEDRIEFARTVRLINNILENNPLL